MKNTIIEHNPSMELCHISNYEANCIFGKEFVSCDPRCCHLTEIHHLMLYDKIVKWCETGKFTLGHKDLLPLPDNVKSKYLHNAR